MALLIKTNGSLTVIEPKGDTFEFKGELYDVLDTDAIELVTLLDGRVLLCDEEAKVRPGERKPVNPKATKLLWLSGGLPGDVILGDVVVCDRRELQRDCASSRRIQWDRWFRRIQGRFTHH
jgi:hypothetical protein